ncbi:MAG TPA: serine/threonine protein kinase [Thermoanaerobaculia bacterium]|jgi:hypothetical protein
MAETVAGFPFWELRFDKDGKPEDPAAIDNFLREAAGQGLTDLFVFSHGWNNDPKTARDLFQRFFAGVKKLLDNPQLPKRRQAKVGTAGVIWPSILFPDEEKAAASAAAGGAAGFGGGGQERDFFTELRKVFPEPEKQAVLDDLQRLLNERKKSNEALREFKNKLGQLLSGEEMDRSSPDNLEQRGIIETKDSDVRELFESLAKNESSRPSQGGGAAGLGDAFDKLWDGAKGALRVTTYYQMKARAGVVGRNGLGPLLGRLHQAAPDLRIHLLGHSFGARLVSYALSGLPDLPAGAKSPVKSLFLLQGAFSHFTFADALPFDRRRKGDLAGLASRVDGPLLTTHSLKDLAVGKAYPAAAIIARQDASAAGDVVSRWGAMGNDGAQAVKATGKPLSKPGTAYPFETGKWLNLDGNQVIVKGGPPSGSHSDIVHPETAWAALAAAGIG